MDETVVNGAQLFYASQFHIDPGVGGAAGGRNQWLLGLVNSAPYVCTTSRHPLQGCSQIDLTVMLRRVGLLVDGSSMWHFPLHARTTLDSHHNQVEQIVRTSGNNLYHRNILFLDLYLARRDQLVAPPLCCSIRPRSGYRPKE